MCTNLKYFLERTTPFGSVARFSRNWKLARKFRQWQKAGSCGPMPDWGKQQVVIEHIKKFSPEVFIETGTYKGRMVYAVQPYINQIYSIELDQKHYENAIRRFVGYPNIHIIYGQSGEILPSILKDIAAPCLFWLDAHWSDGSTTKGDLETPIMQELECILNYSMASNHILLIDDARCFCGKHDYPTVEKLKTFVLNICPNWMFKVKDDIIRIHSSELC